MKKNGKRYRRLQKEKEAHRKLRVRICQEVDDINIAYFAMGQIIRINPIINDSDETKHEYIKRLKDYLNVVAWNRRKFVSAELDAYEKIIIGNESHNKPHDIDFYKYFILMDLMQVMAYDFKSTDKAKLEKIRSLYENDFIDADEKIVNQFFKIALSPEKKIMEIIKGEKLDTEKEYLETIYKNVKFKKSEPTGIMVTATMSAGKSTFINALVGKYICLSQNMACTSKIHCIVNKAFEDGLSAEYDHDLVLNASREELLNDNKLNNSDKIVVSTSFSGGLSNQRVVVNDSPGVNYSGNAEHKQITDKIIKAKNYNLLIYIMNVTQLSTNDESEHLDYVKKTIGRTPILFVINKIDNLDVDEEDVISIINRQAEVLKKKGFKDPVICPVSARAGYLAKRFRVERLSKSDERELYNFVDKFEKMRLTDYYKKAFKNIQVADSDTEEEQLLKTCGLAYIEKIIVAMCKGGDKNGSGIC